MAKAKVLKVKRRRFRVEAVATLLLTLAVFSFLGAKIFLSRDNYSLSCKKTEIETKMTSLKEEVASLESDVNELQNRDRVLSVAEKDNIKTNQDNVTVVGNDAQ